MLEADVPGFGRVEIKYLVSDFTGTLSRDGRLIRGAAGLIRRASRFLDIRVLTFDTFGTAQRELQRLPCSVLVLSGERGDEQKRDYVAALGAEEVIAIGNGANDRLMLATARIGIAVVEEEGASTSTITAATIVCRNCTSALMLLLNKRRLVATLRR